MASGSTTRLVRGAVSLASVPPPAGNSLANVVHGKERDRTSKRRLGVPNPPPSLDPMLPEETMRSDFLEIVQDIQARAAAFAKSAPKVSAARRR